MLVLIQEVKEQDGNKEESGTCNLAVLSEYETIPLKQLCIKLKW